MEFSDRILKIAQAICDRPASASDIDWEEVSDRISTDDERRLLTALEEVAEVLQAHDAILNDSSVSEEQTLESREGRCYRLLQLIGRGGMGVVYKAEDLYSGRMVAVKRLRDDLKGSASRFKSEFRGLVRLSEELENLATLYHLEADHSGGLFFTMELVDGEDFVRYVRGPQPAGVAADATRLRSAMFELAQALDTLHSRGKVHRDIKPSNVLVTEAGRVVIVDFGLAADLSITNTTATDVVGTPTYMAPEQLSGKAGTPAGDWYSVGVMLYEALTGRPPFQGNLDELLKAKLSREPAVPDAGWPELESLCRDLLAADPRKRPTGPEVLRRLGADEVSGADEVEDVFIGRTEERGLLERLYRAQGPTRTAMVLIHGASGVGKTRLIETFLKERSNDSGTVVLRGRCFERESVPYKAFDSVIDELTKLLRHLEARGHNIHTFLPSDMTPLVRIFPAFEDVEAAMDAARRGREVTDPHQLRTRAFESLRELLAKIGRWKKLVVFIDDLQWGDEESAAVLATLLRPSNPPPFLLIGCYRDTDVGRSLLLPKLERWGASASPAVEFHDVMLDKLAAAEAEALAASLIKQPAPNPEVVRDIAKESGGIPFFIRELARYAREGITAPTLEEVLQLRISTLPEPTARLLELVAVAGKPVPAQVVERAAELGGTFTDARIVLESAQLVRALGSDEIETYHDRIRQAVLRGLDAERLRDGHVRLARAFQDSGDPETLSVHFELGGEPGKAHELAVEAAERAFEALAFDRAARLYRKALELSDPDASASELRAALADSLANAGRGPEAAQAYLNAMPDTDRMTAIRRHRSAAEQFLLSGHIDRGLGELERVLRKLKIRWTRTSLGALSVILWNRPFRPGRRYDFQERAEENIPPMELLKVDTLYTAVKGLGLVDNVRAAAFQAKHLEYALAVGEPYRVSRAWAFQALYLAAAGQRLKGEALALVQDIEELARTLDHPYTRALVPLVGGLMSLFDGRWRAALEALQTAEKAFRNHATGVSYELDMAHIYSLYCLLQTGQWRILFDKLPTLLDEADRRGDRFAGANLRLRYSWLDAVAADRPSEAESELETAVEGWSKRFTTQHYHEAKARSEIALYRGGEGAFENWKRSWPAIHRSRLLRVQYLRIDARGLSGRAALAQAAGSKSSVKALLRSAEAGAKALVREGTRWSEPLGKLLSAGVAVERGDRAAALSRLQESVTGFDAAGMEIWRAVSQRRLGELQGGDEGRAQINEADAELERAGVKSPEKLAFMLAPGSWGS